MTTPWQSPSPSAIRLTDAFLRPRQELNHSATIPSSLDRCRETGRIDAFKLDWKPGMPDQPHIFWDSDVAKVLEGMAYDLMLFPDAEREAELERLVALVLSAQRPDGYLNVFFTVVAPENRWRSLTYDHELYCAGHLMEAAVAHFQVTGKRHFLDAMCRYADYIATVFGRGPEQKRGYPGHEEIELALVKLARASGRPKYLDLAKYFVDERGQSPNYFDDEATRTGRRLYGAEYFQAHKPVRGQKRAVGHAVRALYLYSGMADVAGATGDAELLAACERLWESVVRRNMYVTGVVGASAIGEVITVDYNLPNDTAYAESCAAMALVLFGWRMLNLTGDGRYADGMERALYNGALSGLGLDGTRFFYANPLEVDANTYCHGHVHKTRQPWFGCSCCPTSYCRFLPQLGTFACSAGRDVVAVHLPVAMEADLRAETGMLALSVAGDYPYGGATTVTIREAEGTVALKLRVPDWCRSHTVRVNGGTAALPVDKGYVTLARPWRAGDRIELELDMPVRCLRSHPRVTTNAGRMALQRGPLVYALEGMDNGEGLASLVIPERQDFTLVEVPGMPGVPAIRGRAYREDDASGDELYYEGRPARSETVFTAIPSALWGNRGEGPMRIWMRATEEG